MASETAQRILAAYTGRTKSASRQAAGRKGASKVSWGKLVGSKANTQGGNPYWGLTPNPSPTVKGAAAAVEVAKDTGSKTWKDFKKLGGSKTLQGVAVGMILAALANKLGDAFVTGPREERMATNEMETMGRMASPEAAYLQNALPQAQQQEQMMAAALMNRLSGGGVLGPSLAQGEYSIGG